MPEFIQELVSPMLSGVLTMLFLVWFVFYRATRKLFLTFWIGLVLWVWLVTVFLLAQQDKFFLKLSLSSLPNIGLLFVPIIVGLNFLAKSSTFRKIVDNISQPWLIGVQMTRMMGVMFLALYARGLMPAEFAIPAGVGDVIVGTTAPLVAVMLFLNRPGAKKIAIVWNIVGFAELVLAIGLGFLTSPTPYQTLALDRPNNFLFEFPLALIPTFAVPLSLLLHIFSLRVLLKRKTLS
ncbi:MAG: hypothetical protein Q8Q95_00445 [bacterium]|nr:hypothetical protein [bacterium]